MKTPEEWLKKYIKFTVAVSRGEVAYAIGEMQKDAYNQAIEDAAENAMLSYRQPCGDEYMVEMIPCGIDKQSILKLKK